MVDCANGAASELGPRALLAAGARVDVLHAEPDGRNINAGCGSTHPEQLQAAVRARGADLGLALDGDADRVLAVDENGELVDGDQLMVMTALDWHERGMLRNDAIAVTVMSNLGLRRALAGAGVGIVETPVGDRNVTTAMAEHDLAIGGEQSGHIVFADLATTGDGVLTGLIVGDLLARRGRADVGAGRLHDPPAAGARERAARSGRRPRQAPRCGTPCARWRPSSATGAGWWCGAPAPSRSCG